MFKGRLVPNNFMAAFGRYCTFCGLNLINLSTKTRPHSVMDIEVEDGQNHYPNGYGHL